MSKKQITAKKLLNKATEILGRPTPTKAGIGWTKGVLARNKSGAETDVSSPNACRFCSVGVIDRAAYELGAEANDAAYGARGAIYEARERLNRVMDKSRDSSFYPNEIAGINDHPSTTFPQILIAFDLAQTSAGDA